MNDRELLEMAARAAGYSIKFDSRGAYLVSESFSGGDEWNPLTSDGDALRLAVKLMMSLALGPCRVQACTLKGALHGDFFQEETVEQDWNAATRRAIVRAAAAIGEGME